MRKKYISIQFLNTGAKLLATRGLRRRDIISRLHNPDANHQLKKGKKTTGNVVQFGLPHSPVTNSA
jgi:hypothetical protein